MSKAKNILITGATGYIGRRLINELLEKTNYFLYLLARDASRLGKDALLHERVEILQGDLSRSGTLPTLPDDIHAAYFLVHSMSSSQRYSEIEKRIAENFCDWTKGKCHRIIYLSALRSTGSDSTHLKSRHQVEIILRERHPRVCILRAGIVVGSGSASFEIIRDLVEKLPFMIAPKWVNTRTHPIAVRDMLHYLVGVLEKKESYNQDYDVGGPDILTYRDMLLSFAEIRGLKRYILNVPFFSPRLSSYWLYFITTTSYSLARNLVLSMKSEVVCQENSIRELLPKKLLSYREAVELALEKIKAGEVISTWMDAISSSSAKGYLPKEVPRYGCLSIEKMKPIAPGKSGETLDRLWSIGTDGYFFANSLWHLRGVMDQIAGGSGTVRQRKVGDDLLRGDAIGFWRVLEASREEEHLILYSEMKAPGEGWLQLRLLEKEYLLLKASFRPKGLLGRLYWWFLYPMHSWLFTGMLNSLTRQKK